MKKKDIHLSPSHPSLLEANFFKASLYAPVIIDQHSNLIDGYRRFQVSEGDEVEAIQLEISSIYSAALDLNRNSRRWDDIDIFLWTRWAQFLGVQDDLLSGKSFPEELTHAPVSLLSALANRNLQLGQAVRILQAPASTCSFFTEMLSSMIRLNVNETSTFIDTMFDLANRWKTKNLQDVLTNEALQGILHGPGLNPRQKGEALLKEMRKLRYPLYQRKSEELSNAWHQLNLDHVQAKRGLFLDRGVLEITIRARSQQELSHQVTELFESLDSPVWKRIWDHEQ
jgi:hypothetical protein